MSIFPKFLIILEIIAVSWALPERVRVCLTKNCRDTAQMYAEGMDKNADPCQNFYKFTCGGWAAKNRITIDKQRSDRLPVSTVENLVKGMLESTPAVSDIVPIQQAKKFYQSCMNTDGQKARGIKTIASILDRNGGWPMAMNLKDWKEDAHSWQEVDENFTRLTADYTFYSIDPWEIQSKDSEDHIIMLKTPTYHLPEFRENYEQYLSMLQPLVELLVGHNRANVSAAQLKKDIYDLFIFQKKLREVTQPDDFSQLHRMSLQSWTLDWDYKCRSNPKAVINWKKIIQRLFDVEKIEIDDHWSMNVAGPYYWSLIEIWNGTDERTIVNYIHWKFVSQALKYTTEEIRNNLSVSEGSSPQQPHWLQCFRETTMYHTEAYWIVENYFGRATHDTVQKLLENLKKEFKYEIGNSNWMDNNAKSAVQEKLEKMEISFAFPDWLNNRTAIEYFYEGLTIGDDYVANVLSFQRFSKTDNVRSFLNRKRYPLLSLFEAFSLLRSEYLNTPYILHWNISDECDIPSVSFEAPFFSSEIPEYVHYATIGVIFGREIFDGFGANGITHTALDKSMLQNTSMVHDYKKINCSIFNQDKDYFRDEAFRTSLSAYKRLRQNFSDPSNGELKLPGFEEFTNEQMFFIVFGGELCKNGDLEFVSDENDNRSPREFQVNNGVYNTPEFGKAFNCPLRSPMNPSEKCTTWMTSAAARENSFEPGNLAKDLDDSSTQSKQMINVDLGSSQGDEAQDISPRTVGESNSTDY